MTRSGRSARLEPNDCRSEGATRRNAAARLAAVITAAVAVFAFTAGVAAGSASATAVPGSDQATGAAHGAWNWRAHPGMGPTRVSGPVTHPGTDHAGWYLRQLYGTRGPQAAFGHTTAPASSQSSVTPMTSSQPLGLDVSAYQGNVDWNTVKSNGASFAYVKATEGTGYTNPDFSQQYDGSYNVGLIRGAYHFALPDRSSGAAQADYFIDNGGGWSADGQTLPGALDIEYNPYGAECYGLSQSGMVSWIGSFLNEYIARTSRWPVIYSTTDWWTTCTGNYGGFAQHTPLWIACYCSTAGTLPAGWGFYTIWQYADSGTFPGDQDVFNGSYNGLQRLAAGGGSNPSAVVGSDGTVRTYVRGTNRALYQNNLPSGGSWTGFSSMGGTWPANQTALADKSGVVRVYDVGLSGDLYENHLPPGGSWSGWADLGGVSGGLQGVPAAVQDHSGTIRVYVRATNGTLYEKSLPSGGSWSGFFNMGGTWPDNPAALVDSSGVVRVYGVGTTTNLYEKSLPSGGSWSGWYNLGGNTRGAPAAVLDHAGTVRVYVRGTNDSLYEKSLPSGGSWSGYSDMGGTWPDNPGAVVDSNGVVRVYAVGTTANLYEKHLNPGSGWSTSWYNLGGSVTGAPAAMVDHSGTVRVFARGTDAALYQDHLPSGGSWSGMASLGGVLF